MMHMRDVAEKHYRQRTDWPLVVCTVLAGIFFVSSLLCAIYVKGAI